MSQPSLSRNSPYRFGERLPLPAAAGCFADLALVGTACCGPRQSSGSPGCSSGSAVAQPDRTQKRATAAGTTAVSPAT